MIRKNTSGDISDEEFEAILKPFINDYDNFVISYIMPEVIAYYIANSYYRGSMNEGSFLQHYNSAKNLINLFGEDYKQVKAKVYKLLKIKCQIFSFLSLILDYILSISSQLVTKNFRKIIKCLTNPYKH